MAGLRPTLVHARAAHYRRPSGPWDRGPLDTSLPASGGGGVVDDFRRLDSGQVEEAVAVLAGRLRRAGVRRGQVVAWQLPNAALAVILYRACWRLGAVAAPLHHRLGASELRGALDQVGPVMVLAEPSLAGSGYPGALAVGAATAPEDLLDFLAQAPPVPRGSVTVRPSDIAVTLFTSGSTGAPKAVLHTHRALGYKAATMVAVHGLLASDAVLMPAPLAHVSGLLNGVLLPGVASIPSVLMASWDPDLALKRIEEERVSFIGAPPVFFSQMAGSGSFRREAVASLRLVSTGGASVSPAFVDTIAAAFDCKVKRTYGSTEVPTITTCRPGDSVERARDTDGRVVGEAELVVRSPDTGAVVASGGTGELWARGPELFAGYVDPEATARAVVRPGGWFRTGDLGVLDGEGWLTVVGRLSDIIIRAGENISASEVEATLESHPSVRHAVAVPVPDEAMGERVAAFVVADPAFDLAECRRWFASSGITRFKTPELIIGVDEIPSLATGKPDRAALRERAKSIGSPKG